MTRGRGTAYIALGLAAVVLGWTLSALPRRQSAPPVAVGTPPPAVPAATSSGGRKIKARLFYVNDDGVRLTGVERVPTFGGGLRDIELVRWDLAQTRHVDQSNAFAALIEQQFNGRIPLASHPTTAAPLRVLQSANMPAVLIEMGYLTNPGQEKLLASDAFQNAVVQSVYEAVIRFRDSLAGGGTR